MVKPLLTPAEERDENDKKLCLVSAKAMGILYCGLNADELSGISMCKNAKAKWDMLEVTH